MSAATLAMDLRELSPAELTELDAACPGLYADDIAAERKRRRNAATIARRRADPVEQAWIDAAHAQMMQAEAELAGPQRVRRSGRDHPAGLPGRPAGHHLQVQGMRRRLPAARDGGRRAGHRGGAVDG